MRVAITGATGNVGTSLIRALQADDDVEEIVGIARRCPDVLWDKVTWATADVANDDLVPLFRDADAVVHLAWLIQPSRDLKTLVRTNLQGSRRVFDAVARAEVPVLIYASSVGSYSPGPKDRPVTEEWPTGGVESSFYSRHKSRVEAMLDRFSKEHPEIRTVRLRPALIFKAEAGPEVRRLFMGPFVPTALMHPRFIPLVPDTEGLVFQCVHSFDVGEAYRLAIKKDVSGAFNIAADPVIGPDELAELLHARKVRIPGRVLRGGADITWRGHLQPTPPGWVDMGLDAPVMDTTRARDVLGWQPRYSAQEALLELLEGIRSSEGAPTPPLGRDAGGPGRLKELLTRIGGTT